ncbi:MAG: helix-turn-helix domain-containing protein [Desulfosarcinaceae bacterium]|nr:helix-turn-helix domain-containing protein [Desulfosarcinaceae bacterium]
MVQKRYNLNIGLSDYAITAYLSLLAHHPVNGSQLSRSSGIPRARIYDILRNLKDRGFVAEPSEGKYIPLPPSELLSQLRKSYEADLGKLETLIEAVQAPNQTDFIWTLSGYEMALSKAREMIDGAQGEIYVRLFPQEAARLVPLLVEAEERGVSVKCIFMRPYPDTFKLQVTHPVNRDIETAIGGRSFDLVVDKAEFLGGILEDGKEEQARVHWGRNRWSVIAGRDSLRHDFFHFFLDKLYERRERLTAAEAALYRTIREDRG